MHAEGTPATGYDSHHKVHHRYFLSLSGKKYVTNPYAVMSVDPSGQCHWCTVRNTGQYFLSIDYSSWSS